ncbi:hypothetical protein QE152_g27596 [Popillia japonica]|uniref:Uncharacterized protein n=1 Tax=Popillia japonica TaxID=7064 RepID=A0AAW1JRS5_POPJA
MEEKKIKEQSGTLENVINLLTKHSRSTRLRNELRHCAQKSINRRRGIPNVEAVEVQQEVSRALKDETSPKRDLSSEEDAVILTERKTLSSSQRIKEMWQYYCIKIIREE